MGRKIRIAAIGAGNRTNAYAEYTMLHPEEAEIIAVAEPHQVRRERFAHRFSLSPSACYESWETFLSLPKMADAVFICTPDPLHFAPAMLALEKGYDILLEKPIARSWGECKELVEKAGKLGRVIGVCHVLRYHPYFVKLKEIAASGKLGKLISVNHEEAVGIQRMTHAFVRGLWRKEGESNPMILSKACHDLDLLVWLTGRKCKQVASFGSLKWFRKENAPAGSKERCTEGCAVERECPYSALNLYYRQKRWLRHFDLADGEEADAVILEELKQGPYGRCVYRCDNDVVDHQVVSMLMEDEVTVNFSMDGFTRDGGRYTHMMFSEGEVLGDEKTLTVRYFLPGKEEETYDFSPYYGECNFHGGADLNIVADFVKAIREKDASRMAANIEMSLESHRIAFEIEKARHGKQG